MKRAPLSSIFILIGLLFLQPATASIETIAASAAGSAIASELAGRTVSDIINDVRLTGVSLVDQARQAGNALISRAGNEANVLAGNLDVVFRDNLDLTFDRLSEERKQILIEAEALRRTLQSVTDSAYSFKDSTILDLNDIAARSPFVKEEFFVQSIRGLSYLPEPTDFKLQLSATTLGHQEDVSTDIRLFRGHGDSMTPIPDVIVDQSQQRFFAHVSIPNEILAPEFDESELVILPVTVRFQTERKKGWWIFSRTKKEVYDVPIYVNLFPKRAATVVAVIKAPVYDWVRVGDMKRRYSTPNRHCESDCRGEPTRGGNRIEFAVPGGPAPYKPGYRKLVNPTQRCIGGNCGFSDSFHLTLTDYSTRLVFTWDTWSTSGTWEAKADVYEYRVQSERTIETDPIRAEFGRVIEVPMAKDATFSVLKVRTFTKQEYDLAVGTADPYGLLTYQGSSDASPGMQRVIYRVNDPNSIPRTRF